MKNIVIFLILIFASFCFAKEMTLKDDQNLTPGFVVDAFTGYINMIKSGVEGKPLPAIKYRTFSNRAKNWIQYKFFEADTGFQKQWVAKVKSHFDYMGRCAEFCEVARANKKYNTPETAKVRANFVKTYKSLLALVKKPDKIDHSKWRTLQRQKRDWLKVMRKKEKERLEKERYEKRRAR